MSKSISHSISGSSFSSKRQWDEFIAALDAPAADQPRPSCTAGTHTDLEGCQPPPDSGRKLLARLVLAAGKPGRGCWTHYSQHYVHKSHAKTADYPS